MQVKKHVEKGANLKQAALADVQSTQAHQNLEQRALQAAQPRVIKAAYLSPSGCAERLKVPRRTCERSEKSSRSKRLP